VKTVIIEPGLAFGTGTHATTLLCLSWLDELLQDVPTPSFASMLDVGCGSGILSIAAAKLSPTLAIDALDTDPEAHRVSRDNFAVNGVDARVRLADSGVLAELQGSYELVVANILAHILNFLSKDLVRVTSPGGSLLLSGIGEDSVRGVLETFEGLDMDVVDRREREGWTALLLKHRNPGRG
jgi:ribosomal protein L11 methyltransferase